MSQPDIILASASPRRAELLAQIGVRFAVSPADIDESQRSGESAVDYVVRMAVEKANAGHSQHNGSLPLMGADTAVVCGQQVFGKPGSRDNALFMLGQLSGRTHQVLSAVALTTGNNTQVRLSKTAVTFRTISQQEGLKYWQTGEPLGKAGAYAIQGMAALFVTQLEGSYSGVVGLPLAETEQLLKRFAVPVWQTLTP